MARVFIGVGHGGKDPGACANGLKEADVNLIMALALRETLERHGVTVGISRIKDEDDRLAEEIRECNEFAPDLAIECHNNSGGGDGFEVFIYPGSAKARQLAGYIEAEIKAIGQNSRGIKETQTFGWVREVKAPCVLCEGFFLDSDDRKIGDTIEKQRAFGVAYAKGVLRMLGIQYKVESTQGAHTLDNTPGDYAEVAVAKATTRGIIKGDERGDLRLHSAVTRQDLLVILDRLGVL